MLLVGSNIRWEAPLIATRVRKVARKGGKVFAIGPEVDLGMKAEWLGDDLKLLGKLPKAVTDAFAAAERPAVIVGPGALAAGGLGAALALVEPLGLIKGELERLQRPPHLGVAHGVADPRLCAAGRPRRHRSCRSPSWCCCSAPTKCRPTGFKGAFKVYIGHHGDNGARQADLVLPGAAYAEKHGTYVNTEGRVQRGEKAAFPPGEAREDWAILRAVSQLAGKTLPFDSFDQLRAQMVAEYPQLGRDGLIDLPWSPPKLDAKAEGPIRYPIGDFFLTNAICRNSPTMRRCSEELVQGVALRGGGGVTAFFVSHGAWSTAGRGSSPTIIGILVIALPLMLAVAMIIYAERKIWAAMALRRGPNVVGPWGLLQSFADGLKVFLKETIIPTSANKGLFLIAPIVTFTVALIVWAVVPFAPGVVLADVNVGLLYVLAASSLGVYGVIVAGWASNSKYPFFSALRAAAQMVSYEVSIGFVLITVVLYAGTFNLSGIVVAQKGFGLGVVNALRLQPAAVPDVGRVLHQLDG